jgi:hypothetical protein
MNIRGGEAEGVSSWKEVSGLGYLVDVLLAFVDNRGGKAEERRVCFEGLKA